MSRYDQLFARLGERHEGAFVPFIMLSDPDPETALRIVRAAVPAARTQWSSACHSRTR